MTCAGSGVSMEQRGTVGGHTAHVGERCRTCHGAGMYDSTTGPGVNPDRRHGSGRPEE